MSPAARRLPAVLACVIALAGAVPFAVAQEKAGDAPILEMTFEETETVPGQPLTLRLTVYVPTYLPRPPVWPSLEAPNLLVRLPERSTGPVSKPIDGATWAGVSRRYLISPMVPGTFSLPPQEVMVTYADPETNQLAQAALSTGAITFRGVVPEGAEGLEPFLAATSLSLDQEVEGEPGSMKPGDSVTRTVTARIAGTSSMFVPDLLPDAVVPGVAAYPAEPVTTDRDERGTLSGARTERVTYVAEGGGSGEAPAVSLDWYNLESGRIETASVGGFPIAVDGPPAGLETPRDWRAIALAAGAALLAFGLLAVAAARLAPRIRRRLAARRADRLASEAHAFGMLRAVVARDDAPAVHGALDLWAERLDGADPRTRPDVSAALTAIGAARYGRHGVADEPAAWRALSQALDAARRDAHRRRPASALPPLNPGAAVVPTPTARPEAI
tara:strand:+ start:4398 stop:5729 length:1332 start_codon:yes stop_codon:yes gene_type:complete